MVKIVNTAALLLENRLSSLRLPMTGTKLHLIQAENEIKKISYKEAYIYTLLASANEWLIKPASSLMLDDVHEDRAHVVREWLLNY